VSELDKMAAILALSSASRTFSLAICALSFLICARSCFSCAICFSHSIALISRSTTGCQLSLDNQRRQRGSDERYACLLVERDVSSEWD